MKAIYRADCTRGGFIISSVASGERRRQQRFSLVNSLGIIGLLFGLAAMLRFLIMR